MHTQTTIPFYEVVLTYRDSLARSRSLRLAPWLLLLVFVCFAPVRAAGQEAGKGADMYYAKGVIALEKKRWSEAIAEFTKAIELDPNNPWTYHNRGNAYYYKDQYDQAIADYEKAIKLKPESTFYENKARAAKAKKDGRDWASRTFDPVIDSFALPKGSNPQPTPESTAKTEKKASDWLDFIGEPFYDNSSQALGGWQTSWAAFCTELQRLYKRGATADEMATLFAGKSVTWEGVAMQIDRAKKFIGAAMPPCRVTRADNRSAAVDLLPLGFQSSAEIPADLKISAKVRFSTTLEEPNMFFHTVTWNTMEGKGRESKDFITVSISDKTKLLEYEKIRDNPFEKLIEDYDRDPEGTGKQIDKLIEGFE